jgi:hypothetical protein
VVNVVKILLSDYDSPNNLNQAKIMTVEAPFLISTDPTWNKVDCLPTDESFIRQIGVNTVPGK